MDKKISKLFAIISITIVVMVILILLLSGFELSGFKIHKGIKIN